MNFYKQKANGRRVYYRWGSVTRLTNEHLRQLAHRSKRRVRWLADEQRIAVVMMADELLRLRREVRELRAKVKP